MTNESFSSWINQKRLRRQLKWAVETSLADRHGLDKLHILALSNTGFDHIMHAFKVILGAWDRGMVPSFSDNENITLSSHLQMAFDELNDEKGEEPFPAYTMGRDPLTLDPIRDEAPE